MWLLETGSFRGVIVAKIKLTKTAVETAQPQAQDIELRDTVVPGFLCKITPAAAGYSCSSTARTRASVANLPWACSGN